MELILKRSQSSNDSTISQLFQNGNRLCYVCEDVVREVYFDGKWTWAGELKIHGKTAIPSGRYRIVMDYSNRFKQIMPHLLDVPDFEGIRIHAGNTAADTEGCLLPGVKPFNNDADPEYDAVSNSRQAYEQLFEILSNAWNQDEAIFITIRNDWVP